MKSVPAIAALCALAACSFDPNVPDLGVAGGGGNVDAAVDLPDAAPGAPDAIQPSGERHLLLSEVKSTEGGTEFIEIFNATGATISLDEYYLADTQDYAILPGAFGSGPRPAVGLNDFIVGFPAGQSISHGEALVIAINGGVFEDTFGQVADFAIQNVGNSPEMREVFLGSVGNLTSLTDEGEGIALFRWNGLADVVTDVDLINAGHLPSETNRLPDKSGISVDGPDQGGSKTQYRAEQLTIGNMALALEDGQSYQRVAYEDGFELQGVNANGTLNHDETTENIEATWAALPMPTPGSVPDTL